jgi:2-polyprenyl-3-methyl-5-hydroxy-6-metoxy-1,4-benzoquinol methylase
MKKLIAATNAPIQDKGLALAIIKRKLELFISNTTQFDQLPQGPCGQLESLGCQVLDNHITAQQDSEDFRWVTIQLHTPTQHDVEMKVTKHQLLHLLRELNATHETHFGEPLRIHCTIATNVLERNREKGLSYWDIHWRFGPVKEYYDRMDNRTIYYLDRLKIDPKSTIILPGCGKGELLMKIASWSLHQSTLVGLDYNKESVKYANNEIKRYPCDISISHKDITQKESWELLPKADLIIASGLFTRPVLSAVETESGLHHCKEALTPGGIMIIFGLGQQRVSSRHFPEPEWSVIQSYDATVNDYYLIVKKANDIV